MTTLSRRTILKSAITGAAAVSVPSLAGAMTTSSLRSSSRSSVDDLKVTPHKGRIKQSVSRWCYQKIELDELCKRSAEMGLKAVDLLGVEEWDVPALVREVSRIYGVEPAALEELARELTAKLEGVKTGVSIYGKQRASVYDAENGSIYFILNGSTSRGTISVQPMQDRMKEFLQTHYGKRK